MAFPRLFAELYEYCIKEGYADKNLIAKWKKQGYENLCCLRCIQTRDTNFGTNCICRVPKSKLEVVRPPPPSCLTTECDASISSSADHNRFYVLSCGWVFLLALSVRGSPSGQGSMPGKLLVPTLTQEMRVMTPTPAWLGG